MLVYNLWARLSISIAYVSIVSLPAQPFVQRADRIWQTLLVSEQVINLVVHGSHMGRDKIDILSDEIDAPCEHLL